MVSERQIFEISGPCHLTNIDWSDPNHRRCIAASLVRAVQILEFDRQAGRLGQDALAEKWWSFFNFQLVEKANESMTIVGAVFKWSGQVRRPDVPEIVVAFRGTNNHTPESFLRDMNLNLHILRNGLHKTTRFQQALDLVHNYVCAHGAKNVWIAGHSLGAAIGMLVGRHMVEDGHSLEAHLFNPPFPSLFSALPQKIKADLSKIRQFLLNYAVANGKRGMDERSLSESDKAFVALHGWFPCLYVNQNDKISSGYVEYFNQTQSMPVSIKHILLSAIGIDSKVAHFIPSATLTLNSVPATDLKNAHWTDPWLVHKIAQWWAPELIADCKRISLFPNECR